jgi:hypothetical protein
VVYEAGLYNLRWPKDVRIVFRGISDNTLNTLLKVDKKNEFDQILDIAQLDPTLGHETPYQAKDCITILDTELDAMSDEELLELHRTHNIHIVPKAAVNGLSFDVKTCQAMGINVDIMRDVHGM